MKKLLTVLIALLYVVCIIGCGQSTVIPGNTIDHTADTTVETTIETTAETTVETTVETTAPPETEPPETQEPAKPDKQPVQQYEEPTGADAWVANCKDHIKLRKTPGGEVIAKIKKGGVMKLLGWNHKYAKVNYKGTVGYVLANYIKPKETGYFGDWMDVVELTNVYSYDEMVKDMAALAAQYPEIVTVSSIGSSELGRDIPVICIGNPEAEHHVLLQGAIHAREHLTAWLLMAMSEYWLDNDTEELAGVCYHIVPMSNPDGVILSQTQKLTENQQKIYLNDKENGRTSLGTSKYAAKWKSNGIGIDLNHNFPSGWEDIEACNEPSSEAYKGTEPFSAAETAALRDYTLSHDFDVTISYHATGSIIYYEYGNKEPVNSLSKSLGKAVNKVTGYSLIDSKSVGGAGFKDWAMDELGIPSLTIEIGIEACPLAEREIYSIFARNRLVLPAIAEWLQK